jgi:hypothetical protein
MSLLKVRMHCPNCNTPLRVTQGNQPPGILEISTHRGPLEGHAHESAYHWALRFHFPVGLRQGHMYDRDTRCAYLPGT